MTWTTYGYSNGSAVVVPNEDSIEHTQTDECVCGVTTEPIERSDGSFGWVYIHNSLDDRERAERANPKHRKEIP